MADWYGVMNSPWTGANPMAQAMSNPAWQNPLASFPWSGPQNPLLGGRAQPGSMIGGGGGQPINLATLRWPPQGLGMSGSQGAALTGNFTPPTSYHAVAGQRRTPSAGIGPSGPAFPAGTMAQPPTPSVTYNAYGQKLIGGQVVDAPTMGRGR